MYRYFVLLLQYGILYSAQMDLLQSPCYYQLVHQRGEGQKLPSISLRQQGIRDFVYPV